MLEDLDREHIDLILFGFLDWVDIVNTSRVSKVLDFEVTGLIHKRDGRRRDKWQRDIDRGLKTLLPNPPFYPPPLTVQWTGRHFQLPFVYPAIASSSTEPANNSLDPIPTTLFGIPFRVNEHQSSYYPPNLSSSLASNSPETNPFELNLSETSSLVRNWSEASSFERDYWLEH